MLTFVPDIHSLAPDHPDVYVADGASEVIGVFCIPLSFFKSML